MRIRVISSTEIQCSVPFWEPWKWIHVQHLELGFRWLFRGLEPASNWHFEVISRFLELAFRHRPSNWALDGHFAASYWPRIGISRSFRGSSNWPLEVISTFLELAFRGHFEVPRIAISRTIFIFKNKTFCLSFTHLRSLINSTSFFFVNNNFVGAVQNIEQV